MNYDEPGDLLGHRIQDRFNSFSVKYRHGDQSASFNLENNPNHKVVYQGCKNVNLVTDKEALNI